MEKDYAMKLALTDRELNVLKYLVRGMRNEEISEMLNISVHTTKAHLEAIYQKLEVTNRVQAAIKAVKTGLIKLDSIKI